MANETKTDLEALFKACMDKMEAGNPDVILELEEPVLRQFIADAGKLIALVTGAQAKPEYAGQLGRIAAGSGVGLFFFRSRCYKGSPATASGGKSERHRPSVTRQHHPRLFDSKSRPDAVRDRSRSA